MDEIELKLYYESNYLPPNIIDEYDGKCVDDIQNQWDESFFEINNPSDTKNLFDGMIISSYAIILNCKKELLLHYDKKWQLPGGRLQISSLSSEKNNDQLIQLIYEQIKLHVKIKSLIGTKQFKKKKNMNQSTLLDSNRNFIYSTYYLCEIISEIPYEWYSSQVCSFLRFSDLIETEIYLLNKKLLDNLYYFNKIQLILDLDLTLLESAILKNIKTNHDCVTKNDYIMSDYNEHIIIKMNDNFRYVWTRPFLKQFLILMANLTRISYWTAGSYECQHEVMQNLDIIKYAEYEHYVENCSIDCENITYKSLINLNNQLKFNPDEPDIYNLNYTLLIDDNPINKKYNMYNCIQIKPWNVTNASSLEELNNLLLDTQLFEMMNFIKYLSDLIIHEGLTIPIILERFQK